MLKAPLAGRPPRHCTGACEPAYGRSWPTAGCCRRVVRRQTCASAAAAPQHGRAAPAEAAQPGISDSDQPAPSRQQPPRQHQQLLPGQRLRREQQQQNKAQEAMQRLKQQQQQRAATVIPKLGNAEGRQALNERIERLKRQNTTFKQAVGVFLEQAPAKAPAALSPTPQQSQEVPSPSERAGDSSSTSNTSNRAGSSLSSDDEAQDALPANQGSSSSRSSAASSVDQPTSPSVGKARPDVAEQQGRGINISGASAPSTSPARGSTAVPKAPQQGCLAETHPTTGPSASSQQTPNTTTSSMQQAAAVAVLAALTPTPSQSGPAPLIAARPQQLTAAHALAPAPAAMAPASRAASRQEEQQPPQPPTPAPPAPKTATRMKIVFAAAEVAPWSKTGGLGDVMGALPVALAAHGHRVMVVAPRYTNAANYGRYVRARPVGSTSSIRIGDAVHDVRFHHQASSGVDWVFVDHVSYHRGGTPYCDETGREFPDNLFRFQLLTLAALEAPLALNLPLQPGNGIAEAASSDSASSRGSSKRSDSSNGASTSMNGVLASSIPTISSSNGVGRSSSGSNGASTSSSEACAYGEDVMFVANDWHTALLPLLLAARYQPKGVYTSAHCALAIHNLAHQGSYDSDMFHELSLSGRWFGHLEWVSPDDRHKRRTINVLKAGIAMADILITVSQGYAREIVETPQQHRADVLLARRADHLRGITNGVDTTEWDPATDVHLPATYGEADVRRGKAACKRALLRELQLASPVADGVAVPLVAFIGRLDAQKGPDLLLQALPYLANLDCRVVMLGSGGAEYEQAMAEAQQEFGWCFRAHIGFSVPLSHRMMAAADILLMPSRFEPCGLNQLYALRYGTIPVAHATGGLSDTIDDYNPFSKEEAGSGTGWTFAPATVEALVDAVGTAVQVYREQPARWRAMQLRGMRSDVGWAHAAAQYERVLAGVHVPAAVAAATT